MGDICTGCSLVVTMIRVSIVFISGYLLHPSKSTRRDVVDVIIDYLLLCTF